MTPHDNNNHHHRPAVQPARVDNNRSATESQPPSTSNRPSVAMTAVHGKAIDWESINWESSGGRLFIDRPLAPHTWFQVGGKADIFFIADREPALKQFLQLLPATMPRLVIGAASNLLVRDGGFRGAVIKLGKDFQTANLQDGFIVAGAAMLVASLAQWAMTNAYKGFAFYCGIPGTVGGAVAMNAGCFGGETRDLLHHVDMMTGDGKVARLQAADLRMAYRHSELPPDAVCLRAAFSMVAGEQDEIRATMERMKTEKNASQPLRGRTGGSTFKNPRQDGLPHHAWQLIDAVGLRGHRIGGAHFSDKHCNFMMNDAGASAADLEHLGELARQKVQEKFGIDMEWEIKKVGEPA